MRIPREAFYKEDEYAVFRQAGPVLTPEDPWRAVEIMRADPDGAIETIVASGLCGRGGAGFPTGLKWKSVRNQSGNEKYLVCNAAEGEPGTAANRIILDQVPDKLICGIIIGAELIGATKAYLYLRQVYEGYSDRLNEIIESNRDRIGPLSIEIVSDLGGYICGEETALIEALEGKRGEPRLKPPFPTESGLFGQPTLVNNVETFANIPGILIHGANEFRRYGTEKSPGTKLHTISGAVRFPGVYELPIGMTLGEICDLCGGISEGSLKGMQLGGASGCFVDAGSLNRVFAPGIPGVSFGVGDIRFISDNESMPEILYALMTFFASESCGMCVPCKYGLSDVCKRIEAMLEGKPSANMDTLTELATYISLSARCGLGQAASGCLRSALMVFPGEFQALMEGGR